MGGVGINTNNPNGNALRVFGDTVQIDVLGSQGATSVCRNSSFQLSFCSSSRRYKSDIRELALGLETVKKLRPVAYRWTETGEADLGFVAEEIADLDPRLVTLNPEGQVEGVKYERMNAIMARAIQQLEAENTRLRAEMDELRQLILGSQQDELR